MQLELNFNQVNPREVMLNWYHLLTWMSILSTR